MPSAQYHQLDTGDGRPIQNTVLRRPHSSKLRLLCPKTAGSRRIFVVLILLVILFVYIIWCLIANSINDDRLDSLATTGNFQLVKSFLSSIQFLVFNCIRE